MSKYRKGAVLGFDARDIPSFCAGYTLCSFQVLDADHRDTCTAYVPTDCSVHERWVYLLQTREMAGVSMLSINDVRHGHADNLLFKRAPKNVSFQTSSGKYKAIIHVTPVYYNSNSGNFVRSCVVTIKKAQA